MHTSISLFDWLVNWLLVDVGTMLGLKIHPESIKHKSKIEAQDGLPVGIGFSLIDMKTSQSRPILLVILM